MRKNYNKVPKEALNKIHNLNEQYFKVAVAKKLLKTDIEKGTYKHVGISISNGEVSFSEKIIPSEKNGRYSKYNILGREITRKDLPKVDKSYSYDRPNFGDYSKGTHTVSYSKKVWQKEIWIPEHNSILITLIEENNDEYIFKFEYEVIIEKMSINFERELLFALNILQENCGGFDIHSTQMSDEEIKSTIYVDWEILPPGTRGLENIIIGNRKVSNANDKGEILDRIDFIKTLNPISYIKGSNKFSRYFGAQFENGKVLLENVDYGNAIYIIHEDWEIFSKYSRSELINMNNDKITRIAHNRDWKKRVIMYIY